MVSHLPINDIHVHTEDINKSNGNQWLFFFISIIKTKIMIRICKLSVLRILKCKAFTYTNTQAHVSSQ